MNQADIYGVYVPTLLLLMIGAYWLKGALGYVLNRLGFYRHVWHPALFNLALYIMLLGVLFSVIPGVQS